MYESGTTSTSVLSDQSVSSPEKKDRINPADRKKDPNYLRLQIVEQEISEYNILKLYLFIIGVITIIF
jgi:hypothetical protein